jgi:hypothetical protein
MTARPRISAQASLDEFIGLEAAARASCGAESTLLLHRAHTTRHTTPRVNKNREAS